MAANTWEKIQKESDRILSAGIWILREKPFQSLSDVAFGGYGNYLISLNKKPFYIGEARSLTHRLRQQFKPATSTFYKNYLKYCDKHREINVKDIAAFKIQQMPTCLGRKEIEEFGIVNLPTVVNGFQLGKRKVISIVENVNIWEEIQARKEKLLNEGEAVVLKVLKSKWLDCKIDRVPGLYIVENNKRELIYIGESSDIAERHTTHSKTTYFSALRRHIATEVLNFILKEKNGKKKYLEPKEELVVTNYLKSCHACFIPINFARYELEEHLIKKYKPFLNRKDNKD